MNNILQQASKLVSSTILFTAVMGGYIHAKQFTTAQIFPEVAVVMPLDTQSSVWGMGSSLSYTGMIPNSIAYKLDLKSYYASTHYFYYGKYFELRENVDGASSPSLATRNSRGLETKGISQSIKIGKNFILDGADKNSKEFMQSGNIYLAGIFIFDKYEIKDAPDLAVETTPATNGYWMKTTALDFALGYSTSIELMTQKRSYSIEPEFGFYFQLFTISKLVSHAPQSSSKDILSISVDRKKLTPVIELSIPLAVKIVDNVELAVKLSGVFVGRSLNNPNDSNKGFKNLLIENRFNTMFGIGLSFVQR